MARRRAAGEFAALREQAAHVYAAGRDARNWRGRINAASLAATPRYEDQGIGVEAAGEADADGAKRAEVAAKVLAKKRGGSARIGRVQSLFRLSCVTTFP